MQKHFFGCWQSTEENLGVAFQVWKTMHCVIEERKMKEENKDKTLNL